MLFRSFLNEKDECLREEILSDKIEENQPTPFNKEEENIFDLSSIKENESTSLNEKKTKGKKVVDDSIKFLSQLIHDIK